MAGAPLAVVLGTGRVAGGFVAPLLHRAGWRTVMVGRDADVVSVIRERGVVWVRTGRSPTRRQRIGALSALAIGDAALTRVIADADVIATAVGPTALGPVGRRVAPLVRERLERWGRPMNIVTFENHRHAPELFTGGLLGAEPALAREIGRRIGIGGATVWRTIAHRSVDAGHVTYDADDVDECYADLVSLLPGLPPRDGAIPGLRLVRGFDERMIEKLWVFNAGHAAAAYLGWLAGYATVAEVLAVRSLREAVVAVVEEAQLALQARIERRPEAEPVSPRPLAQILARYADVALADPVPRVAREPRRKLSADDRLIAPAVVCLGSGVWPVGLATAIAAAVAYADPSDGQATDLAAELRLVGPAEVLYTVSGLHPSDELSRLVCQRFRSLMRTRLAAAG
jgi:mannitol-1-phosphate 5-dehydrogenase